MNFLFSAFFIILLLSPGVIFRVSYLNVDHGSKSFKSTFIEEMLFSLFPTVIIHFAGYIFTNFFITQVRLKVIYLVLINAEQAADLFSAHDFIFFTLYLLFTFILSALLGWLVRLLFEHWSFDINFQICRLYNPWYYILRGTFIRHEKYSWWKTFFKSDEVWLDILVCTKDKSYIYTGIVSDFVLSKDSGLDRVFLSNTRRLELNDITASQNDDSLTDTDLEINLDNPNKENNENNKKNDKHINKPDYEIPGDTFMIPYTEIENINISYFIFEKE